MKNGRIGFDTTCFYYLDKPTSPCYNKRNRGDTHRTPRPYNNPRICTRKNQYGNGKRRRTVRQKDKPF